jgi:predicted DNA-binding protein (UPF0251 family)
MNVNRAIRTRLYPASAGMPKGIRHSKRPADFQCKVLRAFGLRPEYRDVFLLKEIQGLALAEIADILGISVETVLVRWNSARREIAQLGDSGAMGQTS